MAKLRNCNSNGFCVKETEKIFQILNKCLPSIISVRGNISKYYRISATAGTTEQILINFPFRNIELKILIQFCFNSGQSSHKILPKRKNKAQVSCFRDLEDEVLC